MQCRHEMPAKRSDRHEGSKIQPGDHRAVIGNSQYLVFPVRGACFVATKVSDAQMFGRAIAFDSGADEDVIKAYRIAALEITV